MVSEGLLDDGNAPLDILNAGYKRNIKTADVSILNYVGTFCKKTKIQIFNNLVMIFGDSLVGIISNINNNNSLITGRFLQIFMVFFSIMVKMNY